MYFIKITSFFTQKYLSYYMQLFWGIIQEAAILMQLSELLGNYHFSNGIADDKGRAPIPVPISVPKPSARGYLLPEALFLCCF
jgi:hypothetical protein